MPRILQSYTLWVSIVLVLPTAVILGTWNLLPGEAFYSVKRGLEDVPKLALGQSKLAADYEVALTNRRFGEATTLAKENNTMGLTELQTSLKSAEQKVVQTQDAQAQQQLLTNLMTYNQQLEAQKQTIVYNIYYIQNPAPQTTPLPAETNTPGQNPTPTTTVTSTSRPATAANSSPGTSTPAQTVDAISNTQTEIDNIIADLKGQPQNFQPGSQGHGPNNAQHNTFPGNFHQNNFSPQHTSHGNH